jgi:thymidylate synthase (FAD)
MNVMILNHTSDPDRLCGQAAAICTGYTGDPVQALRGALKSGHESVAEHASFTFAIEGVNRVLLAQITRHRLASFSVQSQRYCGADMEIILPDSFLMPELIDDIVEAKMAVESLYSKAVGLGVPEEDARYFTFQGGATRMIVTMNARELRHFFALRCCTRAQWEIRKLANEMLRQCRVVAPVLFADAGPGCVRGSCPEGPKSCGRGKKDNA